jgi:hypothetical protein
MHIGRSEWRHHPRQRIAGVDDEGITFEMVEDKNTQTRGADGDVMNTLHAANAGTVTARFLKTSATNALLMAMYNEQKQSSSLWGANVISLVDSARGDFLTATKCAFKRAPRNTFGKEGAMMEWAFDGGIVESILGSGQLL